MYTDTYQSWVADKRYKGYSYDTGYAKMRHENQNTRMGPDLDGTPLPKQVAVPALRRIWRCRLSPEAMLWAGALVKI